MPGHVRHLQPSHLISIIQPEFQPERPPEIPVERHLRVQVHDISEPDGWGVLPQAEHVRDVIEFIELWEPGEGSLLVHCFAGVSRSTATALIAHFLKTGDADASARALRMAAPHAIPNRRILALADAELGLAGALVEASERLGPPSHYLDEETLTELEL